MKILGLGHYSRTGKDTLANFIVEHNEGLLSIEVVSFAAKLKSICYDLYGWAGLQDAEYYNDPNTEGYRDLEIRAIGKTPVEIWCGVGMKMREVCQTTWIDYALQYNTECDLLIVTDVRFPNEVKEIQNNGGKLVKTIRGGFGPRDTVPDQALLGWNGWHMLCGPTIEALKVQAKSLLNWADGGDFPGQTPCQRIALEGLERKDFKVCEEVE